MKQPKICLIGAGSTADYLGAKCDELIEVQGDFMPIFLRIK